MKTNIDNLNKKIDDYIIENNDKKSNLEKQLNAARDSYKDLFNDFYLLDENASEIRKKLDEAKNKINKVGDDINKKDKIINELE